MHRVEWNLLSRIINFVIVVVVVMVVVWTGNMMMMMMDVTGQV